MFFVIVLAPSTCYSKTMKERTKKEKLKHLFLMLSIGIAQILLMVLIDAYNK